MKKNHILRWLFLAMGLTTVIGLTGMNVYSLYALHDNTVKNSIEKQKRQLLEFSNQVRSRFRYPLSDLRKIDMTNLQKQLDIPDHIPEELAEIIRKTSEDSLFSQIYLTPPDCRVCDRYGAPVWVYNKYIDRFEETKNYSPLVSDGLAIARTRMGTLANGYRWNARIIFDAHNSMTITLINSNSQEVVAYLNFLINSDYLVDNYMSPKLIKTFGSGSDTGIVVWLHNWTINDVLASTDESVAYSYQKVDFIQNFPDLLNDWNLKAAFSANPAIAASRASLTRNLFVLGGAVVLLIGAFIFMFLTAQRERSLAQRQALFLANVTHELKTPLSVILAAGENLSDGRVRDRNRIKSYGSHIYKESERLRSMIDRLLDVARFDTETVRIHQKWIDAADFTRNLLDNKRNFLESMGFTVHFDMEAELPEIRIDTDDMTSILENLIENAINYSPDEKHLAIRTYQNNQKLYIEIKDHGIGIPRNSQKYIFDKFYRVENALTAQTRGHGLGLSIVKDLVSRNGGEILVDSTPGKGSVFILVFPAHGQQKKSVTEHHEETNKSKETEHVL